MTSAKSPESYPDCRLFLDKSIEAKKGGRLVFKNKGAVFSFRMRCYSLRNRERRQNTRIYEKDDLMYGKTVWDGLVFKTEEVERDGEACWTLSAIHDDEEALKELGAVYEELD